MKKKTSSPDLTDFAGELSKSKIQKIKREACVELFRDWLKERLSSNLSPKEKFLEFSVWSTTFDEIEEYFADSSN